MRSARLSAHALGHCHTDSADAMLVAFSGTLQDVVQLLCVATSSNPTPRRGVKLVGAQPTLASVELRELVV